AFGRVDGHLLALGGVADDLPFVHFDARPNIEHAALLQTPQRITERLAALHRDHRADSALFYFAGKRLEADNPRRKNSLAFRVEHELVAITQKPPCRAFEDEAHLILMYPEVFHNEFSDTKPLDNGALIFLWRVDDCLLERLHPLACFLVENDLRLR